MSANSNDKRIDYLDSIRGLAALSVAVYHVLASHWDWMTICQISMVFFNGSDAVALFFVLSGLVLSYKLFQSDTPITPLYYKKYAIARFFRLYPAFLCMLIIYYLVEHRSEGYLNLAIQTVLHNPYFFWEEALLVRDHHTLFLPDWTLGIEIALSLIVPFMVIIARHNSKLLLYLLFASIFMGKMYISEFLLLFGLGVLIAQHFNTIITYNDNSKWWFKYRWLIFPIVFAVYGGRHILHIYPLGTTVTYLFDSVFYISGFLFTGIAAAILLLYVINSSTLRYIFSNKILVFFGQISYGIYLSHWFFTGWVMRHFDMIMNNYAHNKESVFLLIYLSITLIGSIGVGTLLYYGIERPFITIGRRISARFVQ